MPDKLFKGKKLEFIKYESYVGPIVLMYCPPQTILRCQDKYVVDIDGKYYTLLEVKYEDKLYKMADFVKIWPDVVGIRD